MMNEELPRKKKKSKGIQSLNILSEKPTKEEYMIAKYLRSKLPNKEGKLAQNIVNIFDGNEAVNALLASKWAVGSNKDPLLFPNRHYAVEYLKVMMVKNLFHRALKVKKKVKKKSDEKIPTIKKKDDAKNPKKGKVGRMKLEFHENQTFNPDDQEGDDMYVWLYEPFSAWRLLLGGLVLLVILVICLFPIWPTQLRTVAYYTSIVLMSLLGVLIGLVIVRAILFGLIWVLTLGKHHFWLLPNLTEDCGVIESFKPLYQHEVRKSKSKKPIQSNKDTNHENGITKNDIQPPDSIIDNSQDITNYGDTELEKKVQ